MPRRRSTTSRPSPWSVICPPSARGASAADLRSGLACLGHQTPASRKMMEKIASSTITQKIDSTTDLVVSWPDALGAAADLQALEAADDGDHDAEDRRLDHAGVEMPGADRVAQPVEELHEGEVEIDRCRRPRRPASPAMSPQKASSGIEISQRDDARQDQPLDGIEADRAHGIDLLVDLHRADLGGEGAARAAGDDDRGQQRRPARGTCRCRRPRR